MRHLLWTAVLALGSAVLLGPIGCSPSKPGAGGQDPDRAHLITVAAAFRDYVSAHNSQPPKDMLQLQTWAVEKKKATAEDFASARDGQPYTMERAMGGGSFLIHEQEGKDGKKWAVLSNSGSPSEMAEDGIQTLTGNTMRPGHRPGGK